MNWLWVSLAYVSLFIFGLSDNMRGPLYPDLLAEFAINHSTGSLFFSVSSFVSMAGALWAPWIIRRHGHVASLMVFCALLSLSFFGYAAGFSFAWMLGWAVVFGVSVGGLGVTQNLLVLQGTDETHRGRAQSGLHSCYGASSLLAPGLVFLVSYLGFNWRSSFLLPALLAAIVAVGVLIFYRRLSAAPALDSIMETTNDPQLVSSAEPRLAVALKPVLAMPAMNAAEIFWALLLSIYVALELMVSTRYTLLLREAFAQDVNTASLWTTLFFVGLFTGRLLYTFFPLPGSLSLQLVASMLISAGCLALGLLHRPEWIAFSGFAMSIFYPVWMTSLSKAFSGSFQRVASLGIGLTGISVVAMHTIIGGLSDQVGLISAYSVVPCLAVGAAVMILSFRPLFDQELP